MLAALVLAASVSAEAPSLSKQTLVFFNARVALREGKPNEALKLWLLRNVVAGDEGHIGRYDSELRSVTWAALGELGLCGDGYSKDAASPETGGGAGLWPIAVHNQVVGQLIRGPIPSVQSPYDAFDASRQQRKISLNDVLDPAELRTVSFFRTDCVLADSTMLSLNELITVDATDRLKTAPVMRKLLLHALTTLDRTKVESVAVLEARIFDIDLAMVQLAERRARQKAMQEKLTGRRVGLTDVANAENADAVRRWPPGSRQERVLKASLTWTPDEWLTLSPQRRQFLFAQAKVVAPSPEVADTLALGIADRLAARGEGEELEGWLGFLQATKHGVVSGGDRGKQLLALEPASGFRERAVIALHRGVSALESGEQLDALRSFGYAMAHADESRKAAIVLPLARRWLSYVLSRYSTDAEALGILRALVPRQELNVVLEDLLWRAALRADQRSFDTISLSVQRGGSLDARIAKLKPLAKGDVGALATQLRDAALEEPHLTLRFVRQVLEKIEAEDADVRIANVPMLKALTKVLEAVSQSAAAGKSQARLADELNGRTQGILEGLSKFDATEQGRARSLALRHDTFAGNIRLAPADPLPWPFEAPTVTAAPVFVPLKLQPLEWKGKDGQLVFGWRVTE